jgi:methionyl-tRNA formyltransferase
MNRAPRIVFFGHPSRFSLAVLETLLDAGLAPLAVVQHGRQAAAGSIPVRVGVERPASPADLAAGRGIDVLWLERLDAPDAEGTLAALDADVFLVACFPALLPARIRRLPRRACLNLHPSLLPRYRGPSPLFWQFRNAETGLGVTLHHVAARVDAGPVVARRPVSLPHGVAHEDASARLGRAGATLLADTLARHPRGALPAEAQDERAATRHPAPSAEDFGLSTGWPARRAFAFMRGTAMWGQPYPVDVDGRRLLLAEALEVRDAPAPAARAGEIWVEFAVGALLARLFTTERLWFESRAECPGPGRTFGTADP